MFQRMRMVALVGTLIAIGGVNSHAAIVVGDPDLLSLGPAQSLAPWLTESLQLEVIPEDALGKASAVVRVISAASNAGRSIRITDRIVERRSLHASEFVQLSATKTTSGVSTANHRRQKAHNAFGYLPSNPDQSVAVAGNRKVGSAKSPAGLLGTDDADVNGYLSFGSTPAAGGNVLAGLPGGLLPIVPEDTDVPELPQTATHAPAPTSLILWGLGGGLAFLGKKLRCGRQTEAAA
jgi:hypothetical protein